MYTEHLVTRALVEDLNKCNFIEKSLSIDVVGERVLRCLQSKGGRILIAADSEGSERSLRRLISGIFPGAHVMSSWGAYEAAKRVRADKPHAVVIFFERNDEESLALIKSIGFMTKDKPFIVVFSTEDLKSQYQREGANVILTRQPSQLEKQLEESLNLCLQRMGDANEYITQQTP